MALSNRSNLAKLLTLLMLNYRIQLDQGFSPGIAGYIRLEVNEYLIAFDNQAGYGLSPSYFWLFRLSLYLNFTSSQSFSSVARHGSSLHS